MTEHDAAEYLGLTFKTLRAYRWLHTGPRYRYEGSGQRRHVEYEPADLDRWAAQRPHSRRRRERAIHLSVNQRMARAYAEAVLRVEQRLAARRAARLQGAKTPCTM